MDRENRPNLLDSAEVVLQLIRAAEAVLPVGELGGINEHWSEELDKLEEAVRQTKETLKLEDQPTTAAECEYSIGVLCEHKDFPNKPALCDLGYCPLLKSKDV